jgi:hypothetical protein
LPQLRIQGAVIHHGVRPPWGCGNVGRSPPSASATQCAIVPSGDGDGAPAGLYVCAVTLPFLRISIYRWTSTEAVVYESMWRSKSATVNSGIPMVPSARSLGNAGSLKNEAYLGCPGLACQGHACLSGGRQGYAIHTCGARPSFAGYAQSEPAAGSIDWQL